MRHRWRSVRQRFGSTRWTSLAPPYCRRAQRGRIGGAERSVDRTSECEEGRRRGASPYVAALAQRYYHAEVTEAESGAILAQIRALAPEAAAEFHETVLALGIAEIVADGRTPTDEHWENVAVSRAMYNRAAELHLHVFDLPEMEMARVAADVARNPDSESARLAPQPNAIFCTKAPHMPNAMYGATCGRNCIGASSFDRASTGRIEPGGCDYRFFFSSASRLRNIDGKTALADCVILGYGALISRFDAAARRTEAITGSNVPRRCGVVDTGNYLRRNLQGL